MIGNNMLAIGAVLLIMISLLGNFVVFKKAGELEPRPLKRMTGRVTTGYVNITIHRSLEELDLRARLEPDNSTVTLFWGEVGQDNVSIFITDDIFGGFDYGSPNATVVSAFNWSDPSAGNVPERYYRLGIYRQGIMNISQSVAAKYQIEVRHADGDPTGYEINQVSLPLIPYNDTFEDIAKFASDGDIVLRFNTTDTGSTFSGWETNLRMGNIWLKQFDRWDYREGYVFIAVDHNYNMTIVGEVPRGEITIPMHVATGSPAGFEMMLLSWNSLRTECDLDLALNTTDADSILWFNTTEIGGQYEGWQTYLRFGNSWFPSEACMRPGYGYRFPSIENEYNWTYDRTI
jgi:hypothetical protein